MATRTMGDDRMTLTTKNGTRVEVSEAALIGMDLSDPGFCIVCGDERSGCEPDAREHHCDSCGTATVYGAAELLFMDVLS